MIRVHHRTCGEGPLLVVIHDLGDDSGSWQTLQSELGDRYQVAIFDLLGHGDSPDPPDPLAYDLEGTLADIDDVVAHCRTEQQVPTVIGHRFGALLAQLYARQRPGAVAGLVLIDSEQPPTSDVDRVLSNDVRARRATDAGLTELAASIGRLPDCRLPTGAAPTVPTLELADSDTTQMANDIDAFARTLDGNEIDLRTGQPPSVTGAPERSENLASENLAQN